MKYFIGRLAIIEGDSGAQHFDQALFVAKDVVQAKMLNSARASMWAGDDGELQHGGAYVFSDKDSGVFRVTPHDIREVLPSTYDDLKEWFPVFGDRKSVDLVTQEPSEAIKTVARRIGDQLVKLQSKVSHNKLLHAVAASLGGTDWQVVKHSGGAPAAGSAIDAAKPWFPTGNWPTTPLVDVGTVDFTARVNAIWLTHGDVELAAKLLHVDPEALMGSFEDAMAADVAFCSRIVGWTPADSLAPNLGMHANDGHSNGFRTDRSLSLSYDGFSIEGFLGKTKMFKVSNAMQQDVPKFTWTAEKLPTDLRDVSLLAGCLTKAVRQAYAELRSSWKPHKN